MKNQQKKKEVSNFAHRHTTELSNHPKHFKMFLAHLLPVDLFTTTQILIALDIKGDYFWKQCDIR